MTADFRINCLSSAVPIQLLPLTEVALLTISMADPDELARKLSEVGLASCGGRLAELVTHCSELNSG